MFFTDLYHVHLKNFILESLPSALEIFCIVTSGGSRNLERGGLVTGARSALEIFGLPRPLSVT